MNVFADYLMVIQNTFDTEGDAPPKHYLLAIEASIQESGAKSKIESKIVSLSRHLTQQTTEVVWILINPRWPDFESNLCRIYRHEAYECVFELFKYLYTVMVADITYGNMDCMGCQYGDV